MDEHDHSLSLLDAKNLAEICRFVYHAQKLYFILHSDLQSYMILSDESYFCDFFFNKFSTDFLIACLCAYVFKHKKQVYFNIINSIL